MFIIRMLKKARFMDENVEAASGGGGEAAAETFDPTSGVESIGNDLFGSTKDDDNEAQNPPTTPAAAPAQKAETTAPDASAAPAAEVPAPGAAVAPKTWKPEGQAVWAAIPPAAQAEILRREEDIFRGIEQYKAPAEFGKAIQGVLAPYDQILRSNNMDPTATIGNLLGAHYTLATGSPRQKMNLLQQLAKDYNIPLGNPGEGFAPVADEEVTALREQLHAVQSTTQRLEQARYEAARTEKANEVNAFAADPKNAHFDKVAPEMASMLTADPKLSLADAYQKAIWLNPGTRELEIARASSEKQAKAIADGKAAAEAARAAQAANVKVGPKAGTATLPLGTMEDTMNEVLASIRNS